MAKVFAGVGLASIGATFLVTKYLQSESSDDPVVQRTLQALGSCSSLVEHLGSPPYATQYPRVTADPNLSWNMLAPKGIAKVAIRDNGVVTVDVPWEKRRFLVDEETLTVHHIDVVDALPPQPRSTYGTAVQIGVCGLAFLSAAIVAGKFYKSGGFTGYRIRQAIARNPTVLNALGAPVKANGGFDGRLSNAIVNIRVPVEGKNASGVVALQGMRDTPDSPWRYTYSVLEMGRTKTDIDMQSTAAS
ncbi:Cytochrome oxidase complex assembly protein 1 [Plasmodiophora brassicae]|uniref:Uncharacterized protein n=1 Tax=Plasmodiophora brassicae TaxID=37360 RepID=A0A3P3XYM3_PLABS|nr:unnamed protein product [Plasmodiophora brassicae]